MDGKQLGEHYLPQWSLFPMRWGRHSCLPALVLSLVVSAGCGDQLRRVTRVELLTIPEGAPVQQASVVLPGTSATGALSKSRWKAYACTAGAGAAIDADPRTQLATPEEHGDDLWLLIDLGRPERFQAVRQRHGVPTAHPARYRIDVTGAEGFPWKLVWVGAGTPDASEAVLDKPVEARFLRITVLEEGDARWNVAEVEVL